MKTLIRVLMAVFVLQALPVHSIPMTLVHEGSGAGSLAGEPFDATFTIIGLSDTELYYGSLSGGNLPHLSTHIHIEGVGQLEFLTPLRTFLNKDIGAIGLAGAGERSGDLFDGPIRPVLRTWDMVSSLGPISGKGQLLQWDYGLFDPVYTDGGRLIFADQKTNWRFTAVVATPASHWLAAIGLLVMGWRLRGLNLSPLSVLSLDLQGMPDIQRERDHPACTEHPAELRG